MGVNANLSTGNKRVAVARLALAVLPAFDIESFTQAMAIRVAKARSDLCAPSSAEFLSRSLL